LSAIANAERLSHPWRSVGSSASALSRSARQRSTSPSRQRAVERSSSARAFLPSRLRIGSTSASLRRGQGVAARRLGAGGRGEEEKQEGGEDAAAHGAESIA